MAIDLLAVATDGFLNLGTGGGDITLLEVSAIEIVVADEEYKAVVKDDIITIIVEDDLQVVVEDESVVVDNANSVVTVIID